jgi:hypothetical protein
MRPRGSLSACTGCRTSLTIYCNACWQIFISAHVRLCVGCLHRTGAQTVPALDPALLLDMNEISQEAPAGSTNAAGQGMGMWQLRHQTFRNLAERCEWQLWVVVGCKQADCAGGAVAVLFLVVPDNIVIVRGSVICCESCGLCMAFPASVGTRIWDLQRSSSSSSSKWPGRTGACFLGRPALAWSRPCTRTRRALTTACWAALCPRICRWVGVLVGEKWGVGVQAHGFLAMHYTPHDDHAFASVVHLMQDVPNGIFIRYTYANGGGGYWHALVVHPPHKGVAQTTSFLLVKPTSELPWLARLAANPIR